MSNNFGLPKKNIEDLLRDFYLQVLLEKYIQENQRKELILDIDIFAEDWKKRNRISND